MNHDRHVSHSSSRHKRKAQERGPVGVTVITLSDTRTPDTDVNGKFLRGAVTEARHRVAAHHVIKDDADTLCALLEDVLHDDSQVVILNGGTGISARDNTFDVLQGKLEKTLPGFGEIFRMLSFQQVGSAAMLSRAVAGLYKGKVIISIPGSPQAVELAWRKLIEPELAHLAWEIQR
jgi:molybdenum cofactor biosynthesis protein B